MNEHITIDRHDDEYSHIRRVFTVTVFGQRITTIVTRDAWVVGRWIRQIRRNYSFRRYRLVVGLGVQYRRIGHFYPVDTLQLCVCCNCLIFQIRRATAIPLSLDRFLSDVTNTFVWFNNHLDYSRLWRSYYLYVSRLYELGLMTGNVGAPMETLARTILGLDGIRIPGWIDRSNWERRWLTDNQVQCACVVAYLSFEIGFRLNAWTWPWWT